LPRNFEIKISKAHLFFHTGIHIMCAKFRENYTKTVGVAEKFDSIHANRHQSHILQAPLAASENYRIGDCCPSVCLSVDVKYFLKEAN